MLPGNILTVRCYFRVDIPSLKVSLYVYGMMRSCIIIVLMHASANAEAHSYSQFFHDGVAAVNGQKFYHTEY